MTIEGVGPKRKKQLLKHFGSIKKIREASVEELIAAHIPSSTATAIHEYFHNDALSKE